MATVRDTKLSIEALGLLVLISSMPDGFECSTQSLIELARVGRDKLQRILRELKRGGYLAIIPKQIQPDGKFAGQDWFISNDGNVLSKIPQSREIPDSLNNEKPTTGFSVRRETRQTENPSLPTRARPGVELFNINTGSVYNQECNSEESPKDFLDKKLPPRQVLLDSNSTHARVAETVPPEESGISPSSLPITAEGREAVEKWLEFLRTDRKVIFLSFENEWVDVLIHLRRNKLGVDDAIAVYKWLQSQDWVRTKAITPKMVIKFTEAWLAEKGSGGQASRKDSRRDYSQL